MACDSYFEFNIETENCDACTQMYNSETYRCEYCPDGTEHVSGSCVPCVTGYGSAGGNACQICASNFFSNGNTECYPCEEGANSGPGATECVTCPEGEAFDAVSGTCSAGLQEILDSGEQWEQNSLGFFVHVSDGVMTWDAAQTYRIYPNFFRH